MPINKINKIAIKIQLIKFDSSKFHAQGKGTIKEISTSKIKKINATKKKCIEKGRREEPLGSNPHSKIELFSRLTIGFLQIKKFNPIKIKEIIIIIKINKINIT